MRNIKGSHMTIAKETSKVGRYLVRIRWPVLSSVVLAPSLILWHLLRILLPNSQQHAIHTPETRWEFAGVDEAPGRLPGIWGKTHPRNPHLPTIASTSSRAILDKFSVAMR